MVRTRASLKHQLLPLTPLAVTPIALAATLGSDQDDAGARGDPSPRSTAEASRCLVPLPVSRGKTSVSALRIDAIEVLEDGEIREIALVGGKLHGGRRH